MYADRLRVVCWTKHSDFFAWAKLWLFGLTEGSTRGEVSRHRGIMAVR